MTNNTLTAEVIQAPCRYEPSRLDADGDEVVTETVEIAYESFVAESQ